MSKSGNGANPPENHQIAPDLEDAPAEKAGVSAESGDAPAEKAAGVAEGGDAPAESGEAPTVIELTNTHEGCWKVLADGERIGHESVRTRLARDAINDRVEVAEDERIEPVEPLQSVHEPSVGVGGHGDVQHPAPIHLAPQRRR